jgi:plastocyanin
MDAVKNGDETDLNCGGDTCPKCITGQACDADTDCIGGSCVGNTCVPTCTDTVKNGSESDVDCGGSCADCTNGQVCSAGTDCASAHCSGSPGVCVECNAPADCAPTGNECVVPTCTTNVCGTTNLDGTHTLSTGQTSGDCQKIVCNGMGGTTSADDAGDLPVSATACLTDPACAGTPLAPDFTPAAAGTDCSADNDPPNHICGGGIAAGTCVQCNVDADCTGTGATCSNNQCSPTCDDGIMNGTETGVDCGGSCPDACVGAACAANEDCSSGMCYNSLCVASINGCDIDTATDMTAQAMAMITFPNGNLTYSPKCLKVSMGTDVMFMGGNFAGHPMIGGEVVGNTPVPTGSGPFMVVTNTGTSATFDMAATGTFPYYCQPHATLGMNGVVFVVP